MLVIEFNQSTQGTPNKNTATVLTANGPEKENGSEKKEPLTLITAKTRMIVRPGFTGCGTRLAAKPCLVGVGGWCQFWRVPTGIALIFQEA